MDLQLTDRVIIVIGGTGLIGTAASERLQHEGAHVIAASRSGSGLNGMTIDARDDDSVRRAYETVLERHGRIDGVVMTAAPSVRHAGSQADPSSIGDAIDAKAVSFYRVAHEALPIMTDAGFGRIIGVSGQNVWTTGNIAMTARNAVLNLAAKDLADSVAGSGVTVNVLNPGHVTRAPTSHVTRGRVGDSTPENIADLIAFLMSPLASAISGESISVGHRMLGLASL